jgi:hypothetical protein
VKRSGTFCAGETLRGSLGVLLKPSTWQKQSKNLTMELLFKKYNNFGWFMVTNKLKIDTSKRLELARVVCSGCGRKMFGASHENIVVTTDNKVRKVTCGIPTPDWDSLYNPFG